MGEVDVQLVLIVSLLLNLLADPLLLEVGHVAHRHDDRAL
jgi:hypothetical protein